MRCQRVVLGLAVAAACALPAGAHETDQYTLPVGREFADLRAFYSQDMYDALRSGVDKTNARIRRSLKGGRPTAATARLQSPDAIERAVYAGFPSAIHHVETLELELRNSGLAEQHPGLVVSYSPWFWIYHHPLLLIDPTKLIRLGRCSTVMIDGVLLGNDKFVHFVHMGQIYYTTYRAELAKGKTPDEAVAACIALGTGDNLFLSEGTLLGMLTTGVWSNADLASNYAGLKFYLNLTDEVRVRGAARRPMLERDGEYWRIADHVRPGSDFFTVFVTDHWNEALNPNSYQFGMDTWVRDAVKSRCADVLAWYVDDRGRPRSREDFLRMARDLSTWYGENYGYKGDPEKLVSVATACFPDDEAMGDAASPPVPGGIGDGHAALASSGTAIELNVGKPNAADALGRTELWWAARESAHERVTWLLGHGADAGVADVDGYTPLHVAAMTGDESTVELLRAHGADPAARTKHGATALHLAVRGGRVRAAERLLDNHAHTEVRDAFGCTPLHDAAARGDGRMAALLLKRGADADARDAHGTTPLHRAARAGALDVVNLLLSAGADPSMVNEFGMCPRDEARAGRHKGVVRALSEPRP